MRPTPAETNPLLNYFMGNSGHRINKWLDYFDVYHRHFERFRGKPIKFLEIGIQNGGSARMWRDYFGPQATIIGVDIDPQCKRLEDEGFEVWIGDQADPALWQRLLEKHPNFDIILDDGGHQMQQLIVTFEAMFKSVNDGGVYLCEDTHTCYFPAHGGGLRRPGSFHEHVKNLIDEMHAWYHAPLDDLNHRAYMAKNLYGLSVYDSIVVLEKRIKSPPVAVVRGSEGHINVPLAGSFLDLRRAFGVQDN